MKKTKKVLIAALLIALISIGIFRLAEQRALILEVKPVAKATLTPANAVVSGSTVKPAGIDAMRNAIASERSRESKMWQQWIATPIQFFGKVVDEKTNPVSDATVKISFVDSFGFGTENTKATTTTDENGEFVASGHGLAVVIMTSKNGYYKQKASDGTFGYVQGGQYDPHSNLLHPAIFILRKAGKTEPLLMTSLGGKLNKDGNPLYVDLRSGKQDSHGDLRIECWTSDQGLAQNSSGHFDWRCSISVVGGEIAERTDVFDFQAPADGYQKSIEINMPKSLGKLWRSSIAKEYFVKLSNGTFSRIRFMMNAGGEQTFALIVYLNPQVGSHNLEFDPTNTLKTQ